MFNAYLSNFLALPFYPIGLAILGIAAGLIACGLKKRGTGIVLILFAGIELYGFSSDPLSYCLVRSLERQYSPARTFPAGATIVLLTGGEVPRLPPRLYDEVNAAGDRILNAARLYKQGVSPLIVVSGGNLDFIRSGAGSQADAAGRLLSGLFDIDPSHLLLETKSRNTFENALCTKKLLKTRGLPLRIILVTSAIHMPRSAAVFRKQGYTVFPAPANFLADVPRQGKLISMLPNGPAVANSTAALHEWYGIIAYTLLGRL